MASQCRTCSGSSWKGIALHVGDLPGYPDSHGCVHLPATFADDLSAITQLGTPVTLAKAIPIRLRWRIQGPSSVSPAKEEIEAKIRNKPIPSLSPDAVTSILVSRADLKISVLQNADIVVEGAAVIKDPSEPIGSNVFVW
jgi:hypothetical protein